MQSDTEVKRTKGCLNEAYLNPQAEEIIILVFPASGVDILLVDGAKEVVDNVSPASVQPIIVQLVEGLRQGQAYRLRIVGWPTRRRRWGILRTSHWL